MHDMFKKKICKEYKSKKNQNAFKYGCKHVSWRCGSYRMYLEGDSPHRTVMIVCERTLMFSHLKSSQCEKLVHTCYVFTHNTQKFFATFDTCTSTM